MLEKGKKNFKDSIISFWVWYSSCYFYTSLESPFMFQLKNKKNLSYPSSH